MWPPVLLFLHLSGEGIGLALVFSSPSTPRTASRSDCNYDGLSLASELETGLSDLVSPPCFLAIMGKAHMDFVFCVSPLSKTK